MSVTHETANNLSEADKLKIAETFLTALRTRDWDLLRSAITENCVWTLPGTSIISGEAVGADAVIERSQLIVGYGVSLQLDHILYGQYGVALKIHNQATRGNLVLDEHLATVCVLEDGKIAGINTYLSDIAGVNAFFVQLD